MSYYRSAFSSFEEFQREAGFDRDELGKDELELLQELDDADNFDRKSPRRPSLWD